MGTGFAVAVVSDWCGVQGYGECVPGRRIGEPDGKDVAIVRAGVEVHLGGTDAAGEVGPIDAAGCAAAQGGLELGGGLEAASGDGEDVAVAGGELAVSVALQQHDVAGCRQVLGCGYAACLARCGRRAPQAEDRCGVYAVGKLGGDLLFGEQDGCCERVNEVFFN